MRSLDAQGGCLAVRGSCAYFSCTGMASDLRILRSLAVSQSFNHLTIRQVRADLTIGQVGADCARTWPASRC
jgi:hypothetical protein